MFKRLCNHVSPYTHNVVTSLVQDQKSTYKTNSSDAFLIAKQILADIPIVPTGERLYELAQQIQFGLLDGVCPLENVHNDDNWQKCLDVVSQYLHDIGIWIDADK